MEPLYIMDLFAGAGGLSDGFEQTKQFQVKIAVEIDKHARETYKKNHGSNVRVYKDITKLCYKDHDSGKLKEEYKDIDIVIGGPPCQGFSNANRQKNTLVSSNNQLVKEYLRAIEEIKPKAFVMENVRNMDSGKHKFYLSESDIKELRKLGEKPEIEKIRIGEITTISGNLVNFINNRKFTRNNDLNTYLLEKEVFSKLNTVYRHVKKNTADDINNYFDKKKNLTYFNHLFDNWNNQIKNSFDPIFTIEWKKLRKQIKLFLNQQLDYSYLIAPLKTVVESQKILFKMQEVIENNIDYSELFLKEKEIVIELKTFNVFKYIICKLDYMGYNMNDKQQYIFNAAEYGVPQVRRRLVLIGIREDALMTEKVKIPTPIFCEKGEFYNIYDAIGDLEDEEPDVEIEKDERRRNTNPLHDSQLNKYLNAGTDKLFNHVRTNTTKVALERFQALNEGQNFHDLSDSLKTTYTDHSRTQNTIYKRLRYDKASDTVLNVRKSMWIHPKKNRALSIREAARLQSFQDRFVFKGKKDAQYQQIGNAVPPLLARFTAESVLDSLGLEVKESIKNIIEKPSMNVKKNVQCQKNMDEVVYI